MSNQASNRETSKMMKNLAEDEQRAIAMALSTNVLFNEVRQRLQFCEAQNEQLKRIARMERTYEAVEKVDSQGTRTVESESSELDGLGES